LHMLEVGCTWMMNVDENTEAQNTAFLLNHVRRTQFVSRRQCRHRVASVLYHV